MTPRVAWPGPGSRQCTSCGLDVEGDAMAPRGWRHKATGRVQCASQASIDRRLAAATSATEREAVLSGPAPYPVLLDRANARQEAWHRQCPECKGERLVDDEGELEPCYNVHHQATPADPARYAALQARIRVLAGTSTQEA